MAGKKRAVAGPATPPSSAKRNGTAAASIPSSKGGRARPKNVPAAAPIERAAPKHGGNEKGTPKKKKKPAESQEGSKGKKQQASGGAATTPMKRKKEGAEPDPRKPKGVKRGKEKPADSGGAKMATPSKRKRGDAEPQKEAKSEKKNSAAKKGKDKATAVADPGACSFPMSRVRLLMGAEDATIRSTSEAVFLINKASELFLENFAKDAYQNALKERKKSIIYDNLSTAVCNLKRYNFLSDFVPPKVSAGDALKATAVDQP